MSTDKSIILEIFKDISFSQEHVKLIETSIEKIFLKKGITG